MAVTQNTYTGNGSSVLFSFTFPYIKSSDIKVQLDGVSTTAYTLANATTVQFNTAPANGVAIRIYRVTDDAELAAQFYPGSAIRSQDLNDNFTQNLYVTQEANREATSSITNANTALATANTALSTANSATSTANSATSTANSAVTTANTALTTANSASTTANTAITTANNANAAASSALSSVSSVLPYSTVANVGLIPSSPTNGQAVRIIDSTGIESFTPLSGLPVAFIGSPELTVEIYYNVPSSTWVWTRYYPINPETRYIKTGNGTVSTSNLANNSVTPSKLSSGDGQAGQLLSTNGAGTLNWVTPAEGYTWATSLKF